MTPLSGGELRAAAVMNYISNTEQWPPHSLSRYPYVIVAMDRTTDSEALPPHKVASSCLCLGYPLSLLFLSAIEQRAGPYYLQPCFQSHLQVDKDTFSTSFWSSMTCNKPKPRSSEHMYPFYLSGAMHHCVQIQSCHVYPCFVCVHCQDRNVFSYSSLAVHTEDIKPKVVPGTRAAKRLEKDLIVCETLGMRQRTSMQIQQEDKETAGEVHDPLVILQEVQFEELNNLSEYKDIELLMEDEDRPYCFTKLEHLKTVIMEFMKKSYSQELSYNLSSHNYE